MLFYLVLTIYKNHFSPVHICVCKIWNNSSVTGKDYTKGSLPFLHTLVLGGVNSHLCT